MNREDTIRWGLERTRQAVRFALSRRDRRLPDLAEMRNFSIPGGDGPMKVRLYVPVGAHKNGPLLLYFHGGGFLTGDIDTHDALCTRLADAGRFRIVSCDYRLAPEAAYPAQAEDAAAAARWIIAHAETLGADASKLAIGGDSAGGYLAATVAAKMPGLFIGQVLIYPLMHLEDDVWARTVLSDTRVLGRLAVRFIDTQLGHAGVRAPSLLIDGALAVIPSVIVAGQGMDPCRPDAIAARDLLRSLGAPVYYRDYAGLMHGFGSMSHTSAAARKAVQETGELAGRIMNAP